MRLCWMSLFACIGITSFLGCSGGDSTSDGLSQPSAGGAGGTAGAAGTGGTGGAAGSGGTGGAAGSGGTGGAAGSGGTGGTGGADTFWTSAYSSTGSPNPSDGEHHDGDNCMDCHSSGGEKWLFGGTVYRADGSTPAPHVQVGVRDGASLYTAYSASNGNFWVPAGGGSAINWNNAEVRLRNSNGEAKMVSEASAACNSCHTGGMALKEP